MTTGILELVIAGLVIAGLYVSRNLWGGYFELKAKELEINISDCLDDKDEIERRIKSREALDKITQDYEEAKKVKKAEIEEVNFKKKFENFD